MLRPKRLRTAAASAVLLPALLLTACGSDDDSDDSKEAVETPSATVEDPTEAPETATDAPAGEPSEAETPTEAGATPAWAEEPTTPGELLTTVEAGEVTVEVYQVGTAKAPKDGMFVDPDTNEPILKKGDELVFVNYVITNNGAPIDLGSSLVDVSARYADWKWLGGMDGSSDSALFEEQGVNKPGLKAGAYTDPAVYTFGTGETFSYGDNFAHQADSEIEFTVTYVPVDAKGDLLHDERVEGKASTKIK